MTLPDDVMRTLGADAAIQHVELVGSRACGRATPWSDWDFLIATAAFEQVRETLPRLVVPMGPVVAQWDRLSRTWCFMLILQGPVKIDLIFERPHAALPPWQVTMSTLRGIDDHFWDWMLWLWSKLAAGKPDLVVAELGKLHKHLLGPLGVAAVPSDHNQALAAYLEARAEWERRFGVQISRAAEQAVTQAFHS